MKKQASVQRAPRLVNERQASGPQTERRSGIVRLDERFGLNASILIDVGSNKMKFLNRRELWLELSSLAEVVMSGVIWCPRLLNAAMRL
jgi:hypothetical protein